MTTPTPQFGNAEAIEKEIMNKMLDMYMKKWLLDNGYTEENKSDFHVEKVATEIILYKKVSSFNFAA